MEELRVGPISRLLGYIVNFLRKCLFCILSAGPIPSHVAFIMDGNRRFMKKHNLDMGLGHRAGFSALMSMLKYCCEVGIKHVTFYAFSIDNFRRRPDEVHFLMNLLIEKSEGLTQHRSIVNEYGIRVFVLGNLNLLSKSVRLASEKVMKETENNTKCMLLICLSYTSTDEIRHAVELSCIDKSIQTEADILGKDIKLVDVEKNMYMSVAPDPDIMVRTSGETRLSNFLLWQTSTCLLYSPDTLWPEIGMWELTWAVLSYQKSRSYLEKKKKQC